MSPIRVALVGLSAKATTAWASSAHLPYLLSPKGQSHYTVIALLNTSLASALSAQKTYDLPAETKLYEDPETLANDTEIDLVVCCTRVDSHGDTVLPSIRAGKAVYIEWPLAESLERSKEILNTFNSNVHRNSSIIGLQGRVTPVTQRMRSLLASGTLGRVLSSQVMCYGALLDRDVLIEGLEYFANRRVGGNPIVIENMHVLDWVHTVLGEFAPGFDARMQIQRPDVKVMGQTGEALRTVKTDVPDLLSVQGRLVGSLQVVPNALLTYVFRHGKSFPGRLGLDWVINCELGELRVEMGQKYLFLEDEAKIWWHEHKNDEVKEMSWKWQDWQEKLPVVARSVGEVYERYAAWVESGKGEIKIGSEWPTVGDAVGRMAEVDEMFRQFDIAESKKMGNWINV